VLEVEIKKVDITRRQRNVYEELESDAETGYCE